jgi:hypothetical protein
MKYVYALAAFLVGTIVSVHCNTPKVAASAQPLGQVPEWLFRALQRHLDNPSVLEPEDISYGYVWLKAGSRPQVLASARTDRLNGVIALFEDTGTGYQEVYAREEPVYEFSVAGHRRQLVFFVSGLGGTGVQNNYYYLVGYTGTRYAEIWRGVAVASLFSGPLPYTYTTGALRFDPGHTNFVYTKTTLSYNQYAFEANKPSGQSVDTWLFRLDPETNKVIDSTWLK